MKTYLYQVGTRTPHTVCPDEVWFKGKGSQARFFEFLPPFEELGEICPFAVTEGVHFELKLAKGQWFTMETVDEHFKRLEFITLDVNLEHIDEAVVVLFHQCTQVVRLGILIRAKGILRTESIWEEVGTVLQI